MKLPEDKTTVSIGDKGTKIVVDLINKELDANCKPAPGSGNQILKGDIRNLPSVLRDFCIEVKNEEIISFHSYVIQAKEQAVVENKDWMLAISLDRSENSKDVIVSMDMRSLLRLVKGEIA